MTTISVKERSSIINQKKVAEALLKADALLQIVLHSELQTVSAYTLHDYLWALSDLIAAARQEAEFVGHGEWQ